MFFHKSDAHVVTSIFNSYGLLGGIRIETYLVGRQVDLRPSSKIEFKSHDVSLYHNDMAFDIDEFPSFNSLDEIDELAALMSCRAPLTLRVHSFMNKQRLFNGEPFTLSDTFSVEEVNAELSVLDVRRSRRQIARFESVALGNNFVWEAFTSAFSS